MYTDCPLTEIGIKLYNIYAISIMGKYPLTPLNTKTKTIRRIL